MVGRLEIVEIEVHFDDSLVGGDGKFITGGGVGHGVFVGALGKFFFRKHVCVPQFFTLHFCSGM